VEDFSLKIQLATIFAGIFFNVTTPKDMKFNSTEEDITMEKDNKERTDFIFAFIVVSINVIFTVFWLVNFVKSIKNSIRENNKKLYINVFLCCRADKLNKDDILIKREEKSEVIIEKIEDIQFFVNKMRMIYTKGIFYEGHDKFLNLLYYIENERKNIDLTVKTHNLYI
jgi:hypothetical protein